VKKLVIVFLWIQIITVSLYAESYMDMKKVAYRYHESGQTKKALHVVNNFIKKNPKDYRGKNLLAVLYYWNGDKNRAKKILKDIVSKTDFPDASKLLIKILYKQKKYNDVIYYATNFLKKHKNNAVSKRLASSYKRVGKVKKVKTTKPKMETTVVKFEKEKSEPTQKRVSDDLVYILDVVKKDPKDAMSRSILAQYFYNQGDLDEAYKYAKEVLKIDNSYKSMEMLIEKIEKNRNFKPQGFNIEQKAKKLLENFYKQKEYLRYVNLYKALKGQGISFREDEQSKMLMSSLAL